MFGVAVVDFSMQHNQERKGKILEPPMWLRFQNYFPYIVPLTGKKVKLNVKVLTNTVYSVKLVTGLQKLSLCT